MSLSWLHNQPNQIISEIRAFGLIVNYIIEIEPRLHFITHFIVWREPLKQFKIHFSPHPQTNLVFTLQTLSPEPSFGGGSGDVPESWGHGINSSL